MNRLLEMAMEEERERDRERERETQEKHNTKQTANPFMVLNVSESLRLAK